MRMDIPNWEDICSIIQQEDVLQQENRGIEHNPHVTVLYGFYSFVTPKEVMEVLMQCNAPTIRLGHVGIFEDHPEFDVVMITVESQGLAKLNLELTKLPNEETFPTYHPHVTIAYVKKGTAKKYLGTVVGLPEDEILLTHAEYSMPSGEKIQIELNVR